MPTNSISYSLFYSAKIFDLHHPYSKVKLSKMSSNLPSVQGRPRCTLFSPSWDVFQLRVQDVFQLRVQDVFPFCAQQLYDREFQATFEICSSDRKKICNGFQVKFENYLLAGQTYVTMYIPNLKYLISIRYGITKLDGKIN